MQPRNLTLGASIFVAVVFFTFSFLLVRDGFERPAKIQATESLQKPGAQAEMSKARGPAL